MTNAEAKRVMLLQDALRRLLQGREHWTYTRRAGRTRIIRHHEGCPACADLQQAREALAACGAPPPDPLPVTQRIRRTEPVCQIPACGCTGEAHP